MNENEKYKVPESNEKDAFHSIARGMIGSIPVAGAAGAEIFNLLITPSLEKRRTKWMEEVAEALRVLEQKYEIIIEELSQNETFINTILHASQAAMRTNKKEKIEALRNAIVNAALPNSPDDDTQQIFLHLVDTFTQIHIRILKFLKNPPYGGIPIITGNTYIHLSDLPAAIEKTYPELKGRYNFYYQIIRDLSDRGLVNMSASDTSHDMAMLEGIPSTQVTELGAEFLAFIESHQNRE